MSAGSAAQLDLTNGAVIAAGKHLFPFRTEKLSPLAPMVLGEQSPGRVGRRPFSFTGPARGPLFGLGRRASFSRQSGSSARSRRTRSPSGGCVTKSAREPLLGERIRSYRAARSPGSPGRRRAPSPARAGAARRRARAASRRARPRSGRPRTRGSARARDARTRPRSARGRRGSRAGSSRRCARSSMIAAATTAATVWVRTSRLRRWAISWATIPSSSAGVATPSRPEETASAAPPRAPRPAESARGYPSGMR